ncbi:hypothetical protein VTO42DRAFT_5693 [Malbranchea cinnamomea]
MRASTFTPLLRQPFSKPSYAFQQTRYFGIPSISSFTPSLPAPAPRTVTATRTLPLPPLPLFRTISSVEAYGEFLPFLTASTVTARDRVTGYPSRAYLTVGYGPLSETFLSKVECDEKNWTVCARSGERAFKDEQGNKEGDGGIFEYLDTMWKLTPLEGRAIGMERTRVDLSVNFKFRSAVHAAMMSAVEGQVAGMMIEAFEKRVKAVQGVR